MIWFLVFYGNLVFLGNTWGSKAARQGRQGTGHTAKQLAGDLPLPSFGTRTARTVVTCGVPHRKQYLQHHMLHKNVDAQD